jgi:release factor glutamine methyltransferase
VRVNEYIHTRRDFLLDKGVECGDFFSHTKRLVQFVKGWSASELVMHWHDPLHEEEIKQLDGMVEERVKGRPLQYLTQVEWFWNSPFAVGPGVLIPRPETEILVEKTLALETRDRVRIAELGAGSGNIGISCLLERPKWEWYAFELNNDSIPYAEKNRDVLLPPDNEYGLITGDFFLRVRTLGRFDWIVANAPYVPQAEIDTLSLEVRCEPRVALDGGKDGVEILERLLEIGRDILVPGGRIALEYSPEQTPYLVEAANRHGYTHVSVFPDNAGKDRVLIAERGA